jgi:transposase
MSSRRSNRTNKAKRKKRMPTLWEVPDAMWERIEPILLKHNPPKARGRKRVGLRRVLDGIIFRLRTGCRLPMESHSARVWQ